MRYKNKERCTQTVFCWEASCALCASKVCTLHECTIACTPGITDRAREELTRYNYVLTHVSTVAGMKWWPRTEAGQPHTSAFVCMECWDEL